LPYVIIYSTMTVDGRIASQTGYSKLSCPWDLKRLHELRAASDCVMVGAGTVIADDPSLKLKYASGIDPLRVIIDGKLKSPASARVFTQEPWKTVLITSRRGLKAEELGKRGVRVLELSGNKIKMKEAMRGLYDLGCKKIMVEGGGRLNWSLMEAGVVNELRVTVSPFIFGAGRSLIDGTGFPDRGSGPRLELRSAEVCECGKEVHIIYEVKPSPTV
jgi:2,5-diamino-6-(ribosylamino)-4(3H)-pyrimidinone 5'-phosphate reductase